MKNWRPIDYAIMGGFVLFLTFLLGVLPLAIAGGAPAWLWLIAVVPGASVAGLFFGIGFIGAGVSAGRRT